MEPEKRIEFAVKALIMRDGRFLALRQPTNELYELPGGRMEFGETAEQTLQRELSEEIGLGAKPVVLLDTWNVVGKVRQITGIIYLCSIPHDADITLSAEHEAYEWMPATQASFDRMFPAFGTRMTNWDWDALKAH